MQLRHTPGVELKGTVHLLGKPILDVVSGAKVTLGNNVLLNSENRGYHLNMHSPVKLMADRPGASITIGPNSRIHGACIHAYSRIEIGSNCLIAANTQIMDGSGHDLALEAPEGRVFSTGTIRPVIIEDNVWLGVNVVVLPGVRIGEGAVVAAGAVVTRDVPPRTLVGGQPARVIRTAAATPPPPEVDPQNQAGARWSSSDRESSATSSQEAT